MRPDMLLGKVPKDLACGIALNFVEWPAAVANVNAFTVEPLGRVDNWLAGDDPLDVATREYLQARQAAVKAGTANMGQGAWAGSSAIKAREEANRKALEAKKRGLELLRQRGVLDHARKQGLHVIDPGA